MAKLLSTIIDGFTRSRDFLSGALGSGWRIAKLLGRWVLEIDDIVVRGRMTVFELLISKIRAVKGALGITQASGKIKEIREDATNFYIQLEDAMSFVANDIIRCSEFSGGHKNYWVIVSKVENNELVIPKIEFENSSLPGIGDELVQFGNTTDTARQSAIYLHADEGGQPAIDVLFGIDSKSFDGKTKIRIGGDIPGADGYKGFYCENGMIKSVNEVGETMYMLRPDGSGLMAKGNISWDKDGNGSIFEKAIYWDTDGFHFGSGVKLTWDNLPPDAKEMLKGDKGDPGDKGNPGNDANLLPWVEEWASNKTEIGGEYIISPKIFSGKKGAGGKLTGVAFGRGVIEIDGVKKTGVFGVKDGNVTFSIDAETGDAFYGGTVLVEKDSSNFVKIYHDSPGDWGVKGVSGGDIIFQVGSVNRIGPLFINKDYFYFGEEGSSMNTRFFKNRIRIISSIYNTGLFEAVLSNQSVGGVGFKADMSMATESRCLGFHCNGMSYFKQVSYGVKNGNIINQVGADFRYFLHSSSANETKAVSHFTGAYDGQVITIVNCNSDNYNITLTGVSQYRSNGSVASNHNIEMTDGGAEVTLVYHNANWFFAGRSGNAKF